MKYLLLDSTSLSNRLSEAAEESDPDKKSELIGRVVLLSYVSAVILLVSYRRQTASVGGNNSSSSSSSSSCKDYLIRFDAGKNPCFMLLYLITETESLHLGTQLAYACSDLAAYYEKEELRSYEMAILLYELLLSLPYLEHRRGKWYLRLCIDYEHLKYPRCALRAVTRGMQDHTVTVSE